MATDNNTETNKPVSTGTKPAQNLGGDLGKPDTKDNNTALAKVRKHKTLGEYKKCVVHPTRHAQANTNIFVSIGLYTAEFKPEIEVELPSAIIDLLKTTSVVEHYYDAKATSENGNKGAHLSRPAKKYIVELV